MIRLVHIILQVMALPGSLVGGGEVEDGCCGVGTGVGGSCGKTSLDGVNKRIKIGTLKIKSK